MVRIPFFFEMWHERKMSSASLVKPASAGISVMPLNRRSKLTMWIKPANADTSVSVKLL